MIMRHIHPFWQSYQFSFRATKIIIIIINDSWNSFGWFGTSRWVMEMLDWFDKRPDINAKKTLLNLDSITKRIRVKKGEGGETRFICTFYVCLVGENIDYLVIYLFIMRIGEWRRCSLTPRTNFDKFEILNSLPAGPNSIPMIKFRWQYDAKTIKTVQIIRSLSFTQYP